MTISPAAIGIGAGIAGALGIGFGASKIMDGIADRHPTGSGADRPAGHVAFAAGALGFATAAGGMVSLVRGNVLLGAGLLGAGAGTMLGSIGAGMAFTARHGVGVDTTFDSILGAYDQDGDRAIDMTDGPWWRGPETTRVEHSSYEDSNGDTHWETDWYSIDQLAERADVDRDWSVTSSELRATISSFDGDGNGRLQGSELARFEREVGERQIG